MKLEKACMLTKRIAEAEDTKQEARMKPCYFTRTRKMSFTELAYYIFHPGKESTHLGLKRFFEMIGKEGRRMSEQAFSKARGHFSHWPFEKMVRETTVEEYRGKDVWTWDGCYLFAIDGTTVALPDKPALCGSFGGSGRKKDGSITFLVGFWATDVASSERQDTKCCPWQRGASAPLRYHKALCHKAVKVAVGEA